MTNPFENIDKAFKPFEEPLEWRMDAKPHTRGVFRGVLLQGSMENSNAGVSISPLLADMWTIQVCEDIKFLNDIKIGDEIVVLRSNESLTVQQTYHDAIGGFWISCTANQRSPM